MSPAGAGPVGLFAAFKFFMAGANVLIVNDRIDYTRNRAIFFDQRWMQQLRFLLGTKFYDLFVDEMSPGHINMPENVGQTNIKEMEVRLMKRLKSMEHFLNKKFGPKQIHLHLRYGVTFERVEKAKKSETGQIGVLTVVKGKSKQRVEEEIDFLVCAGGANDRIRDKYIGNWEHTTKSHLQISNSNSVDKRKSGGYLIFFQETKVILYFIFFR
jgi:2-polyprenyl-6-methoxyphenol hydroxylase-like FAD-dependent oxidoreductase